MKKEKYTLEYYEERDRRKKELNHILYLKKKELNHILYLKKKYKISPEEYENIKINRKNDILSEVLEMCQKGFKNIEIAKYKGIAIATVSKYKRILKDKGFYVEGKAGRPSEKIVIPR